MVLKVILHLSDVPTVSFVPINLVVDSELTLSTFENVTIYIYNFDSLCLNFSKLFSILLDK
jgi:hypothetical protein